MPSLRASFSRLAMATSQLGGCCGLPRLLLRFQSAPSGAHRVEMPCSSSGNRARAATEYRPSLIGSPTPASSGRVELRLRPEVLPEFISVLLLFALGALFLFLFFRLVLRSPHVLPFALTRAFLFLLVIVVADEVVVLHRWVIYLDAIFAGNT